MIKRIAITGTESTGKTELAGKLATHYKTVVVPDYSRQYIEKLGRKYNHTDVLQIAKRIIEEEDKMLHYAHQILFSDNDLINIKIWMRHYKWHVPDWMDEEILKRKYDLYLLCDIGIPWVGDKQRENPDNREDLFNQFKQELILIEGHCKIIGGKDLERTDRAIQAVDEFISLR